MIEEVSMINHIHTNCFPLNPIKRNYRIFCIYLFFPTYLFKYKGVFLMLDVGEL